MVVPDDPQEQDLEQVLADHVRAIGWMGHLKENLRKYCGHQGFVTKITEYLHAGLLSLLLEGDAVYTDHVILQGDPFDRLFRVFNMRRYDHKISGFDIVGLRIEEKVPLPPDYIEKFCKRVGMENALPVAFIFGMRDGQKVGVQLLDIGALHGILSVTHKNSFVCKCYQSAWRRWSMVSG